MFNSARRYRNRGASPGWPAKERRLATLRPTGRPGIVPPGDWFANWSRRLQCPAPRGSGAAVVRVGALLGYAILIVAGAAGVPGGSVAAEPASRSTDAVAQPVPVSSFAPPFARAPLALPLVLNGGFCEYRSNHFHAGLDLGTGGSVGRPVFAPTGGWIERVRASGAGYGRSIYLHAEDGRLLVFAHLDAYAEPLAGFVEAAQESTGQYEQDLWPASGRFRVAAGQRIGWTGESGSGGPHLHFEVRRGDMAYHPLRSGLAIPDSFAPTLASVTLEPLDDTTYVERSAAPVTVRLGERAPTVSVVGRVRAVVAARDGVWRGVDRMVPWSVSLDFAGIEVECRFDSVSWATDMAESDHLYDSGRVVGERGMVMWAPEGFRPRVLRANVIDGDEAGTLVVRPGDPSRTLRITARDLAGRVTERSIVLQPPPAAERGPDTTMAGGRAEADSTREFELAALPANHLRVTYRGAPAGSRGVTIGGRPASLRNGDWTAVVALTQPGRGGTSSVPPWISGRDAAGRTWGRTFRAALRSDPTARRQWTRGNAFDWVLPRGALFESAPVFSRWTTRPTDAPSELDARSESLELLPANLRLRKSVRIEWGEPAANGANVGLFADDGSGWSWLASPTDSALQRRVGETRHLGRFALFADTLAPRVTLRAAPRSATKGPYSRWALEARVAEAGSGVDRRGSWFEMDGRRMPAEWDDEAGVLRWRPLRPPGSGAHRYEAVVRDRAGNERRASGRFEMK